MDVHEALGQKGGGLGGLRPPNQGWVHTCELVQQFGYFRTIFRKRPRCPTTTSRLTRMGRPGQLEAATELGNERLEEVTMMRNEARA